MLLANLPRRGLKLRDLNGRRRCRHREGRTDKPRQSPADAALDPCLAVHSPRPSKHGSAHLGPSAGSPQQQGRQRDNPTLYLWQRFCCVSVCRRAVRLTRATGHGTVPAMTDMVSGPHVHAQADGAIVSEEELKLLRALEQLWQQKLGEKDEEVARLSGRLRRAETERDVLRNSLRAVWARLGEEPRGPSPGETQVEPSPVPMESAMTSFDTGGTPREGIAARAMAPTGGRFRSPEVVARVVREAGRPLTRTEIREEMERRGLIPTTWANPQNATSTATLRAKQRGLIVEVMPGSFGPPPELSTDAGWA